MIVKVVWRHAFSDWKRYQGLSWKRHILFVPDRRVRNIPEVVLVRRWAVGVLGIGGGGFG